MTGCDDIRDPIREEALDWLLAIEAAPDDEALRAALAAWRGQNPAHEAAYRSVERAWQLAGDLPPDYAKQTSVAPDAQSEPVPWAEPNPEADETIGADVIASRPCYVSRRRVAMGTMAVALAACLAVFLGPIVQLYIQADYVTGVGEIRKITLDDGSMLHLDAESAAAVSYGPSRRTVRLLAGQAFFDVVPAPSRPFTVAAEGLVVTVTGTSFTVGAAQDGVSVAVQSGSVEVAMTQSRGEVIRLAPGDRLTAHEAGAVTRTKVPPSDIASWRYGRLVVDGVPLAEVVERLDRHHRGIIWLRGDAALAERRITGVLNLNDPVAALRAAVGTQGAQVTELTPYLLVVTPR